MLFFGTAITAFAWDASDPESIKEYVHYIAQREDVPAQLLIGIIKAESGFDPDAKNPKSSASGVGQFINSTFREYCLKKYKIAQSMEQKNNPFIQIMCMAEMLKEKDGWKHWSESAENWKKHQLSTAFFSHTTQ